MESTESIELRMLLAEREIARAVVRFARAMDDREWAVLHEVMLPDATADLGTGTLRGPAEVVAVIRSFLDGCGPTQHLLGNMLVDVDLEPFDVVWAAGGIPHAVFPTNYEELVRITGGTPAQVA